GPAKRLTRAPRSCWWETLGWAPSRERSGRNARLPAGRVSLDSGNRGTTPTGPQDSGGGCRSFEGPWRQETPPRNPPCAFTGRPHPVRALYSYAFQGRAPSEGSCDEGNESSRWREPWPRYTPLRGRSSGLVRGLPGATRGRLQHLAGRIPGGGVALANESLHNSKGLRSELSSSCLLVRKLDSSTRWWPTASSP